MDKLVPNGSVYPAKPLRVNVTSKVFRKIS